MLSSGINLPQSRPQRIYHILVDLVAIPVSLLILSASKNEDRHPYVSRKGNFNPDAKMDANTAIILLMVVGCAVALPVRPENNPISLVGIPVIVQEPSEYDGGPEVPSPLTYALLMSKLSSAEATSGNSYVEKRNAQEEEEDDLETAAGTYALRPLFVYRQQVAYRQRARDAIRRRDRN